MSRIAETPTTEQRKIINYIIYNYVLLLYVNIIIIIMYYSYVIISRFDLFILLDVKRLFKVRRLTIPARCISIVKIGGNGRQLIGAFKSILDNKLDSVTSEILNTIGH